MKEKITKNIGLKSLSVFIAILLWIIIVNVDNPITTAKFRDVPVKIINDNIVLDLDQVYDVTQGETVDFTVEARKNIVDRLKTRDFNVIADFNKISVYDTIQIEILPPEYDGERIRIVEGKYPVMKISREASMEKNFKVDIIEKGNVAEGHYIGEKTASPNILTISGPRARVENVASIVVEIDVTGASESFNVKAIPKPLDSDGQFINDLKLTLNEEEVSVKVKIFKTKQINLLISPTGEPFDGYKMTDIEYEPRTITIAGIGEEFNDLRYISINEDIGGATTTIEKDIELQDYLPEGIYLVGEPTAVVKIKIERLKPKTLSILPIDLRMKNKPEATLVRYKDALPITITVLGTQEDLEELKISDIKPYIDLSEIRFEDGATREFEVPVLITSYKNVMLSNEPIVNILITN